VIKKIKLYILIILLIPAQFLAQEATEKKKTYAQVQKEGVKKLDNISKAFRVFEGEILERKGLISTLPNNSKLRVGNGGDMKPYVTPKVLRGRLLKEIVKKQKVFLEDGKLYEGYLFDFRTLAAEIGEKEIKVASYLRKKLSLKKKGNATISYPYDASGLVYFYKSAEDFSDPYIRIIIPGYVTSYVDKNAIDSLETAYDDEVFKKYDLVLGERKPMVEILYKKVDDKVYKIGRNKFDDIEKLEEGNYKVNGKQEEFVYKDGKVTIGVISDATSDYDIWIILTGVQFVIILLVVFKERVKRLLSKERISEKKTEDSDQWGQQETPDQNSFTRKVSAGNAISVKSLKDVKKEVILEIQSNQKKTANEIRELKTQLNNTTKEKLTSLKTKNTALESEKQQLIQAKEKLKNDIESLNDSIDEKVTKLSLSDKKIRRFESQAFFIENYASTINKLIAFFDFIKQLEQRLLAGIHTQNNYTIKQFQSAVFAKYLHHKITNTFKDWDAILRTIKSNEGLIVDKNLIHQIKGKTSTEDQLEGIEWIVVNDVLIYKVDKLLILLEELRNTSRITGVHAGFSSDEIEKNKMAVIGEMRSLFQIQIENLKLFSHFESYSNIKSVQEKLSYELHAKELGMGTIQEIKTYGMKLKGKTIETIVVE